MSQFYNFDKISMSTRAVTMLSGKRSCEPLIHRYQNVCNKSIIRTECTGMRIDKQPHGIEERPETPIHTKSPCLQGSSNQSLVGEQMVSGDGNRIVK